MMITDPQMHENPPKKTEGHPKRAKYGQKWPKMEKCDFLKIPQWPDFEFFFGDWGASPGEVMIISEQPSDLPVLLIFVGVASSA